MKLTIFCFVFIETLAGFRQQNANDSVFLLNDYEVKTKYVIMYKTVKYMF